MAAEDQALSTNNVKATIDKRSISPMCRLCGEREETISHIKAECTMYAQKQCCLWRHDKVALVIHWKLCERYGFDKSQKWYDHRPQPIVESEETKILWDFNYKIQTDQRIDQF